MALKAFWLVLLGKKILVDIDHTAISRQEKPLEDTTSDKSVFFEKGFLYAFSLLQREGRWIDFIEEDIEQFSDSQIGAAARQVHTNCRKAIKERLTIESLLDGSEGETIRLDDTIDRSKIKLSGTLPNTPPYQGILVHRGWKVTITNLPKRNDCLDPTIIQAAEVEIQS